MNKCCRIVVTGGPGGGKTTAADLFRRELGEQVVIVPESATLLYSGGFPRSHNQEIMKYSQQAIYSVQRNLEDAQSTIYQNRILICDRGTIDGAAYWPGTSESFFTKMNTTLQNEFTRYDSVLFFETAAVGGISIEGGNPIRIESLDEAIEIDKRLKDLWSAHPNFIFIPHNISFLTKIGHGLNCLNRIVNRLKK